ncbi:hypothetical protein [Candidatus Nitronereus thalassa]|uniref:Uncharacterized protein n=1 Tax=Candidatus Nitronereus thalassa TaxID=3020898 RepID=A0ABU3KAX0_9BACT|nr:hypothetical protein [Candidatus Nitronereus thalassa]MDT7043560.1 hypothetical protein [Candidatus Nitronereus thalassa]
MVIALLLLAGHVHPWEGIGLQALLVLSIPIDIWALGLCSRTVFLERLSVDPPKGSALRLWAQWAVFSIIYLPLLSMIVGGVKALAKSATEATLHYFEETFMVIPVAEKITIELVMWGIPATIVLIILLYGWLFGLGALAQRHVRASTPVSGSFQDIVYKWDLLRIPNDQPLTLVAFTGVGLVLVFLFWGLIPVSTPHPHEEYQFINVKNEEVMVEPKAVLKNAEQVLLRAEATIKELEKDNPESQKSEADKKSAEKPETKSSAQ